MAFMVVEKERGELRIHESLEELKTDLVEYIAELSDSSIKERGVFAIALSCGPLIDILGKLCEAPYKKTVDWSKWYILWTDERVVSKSHVDSNYKHAKQGLLSKLPILPSHVYFVNDSLSAEEAAEEYEFGIRQLVKLRTVDVSEVNDCPKFDLVILEMGSDGRVASLFPNHPLLDENHQWVTYMTDSPEPPPERITFTFPVINSSENVFIVVSGESKADAAHLAIDDVDFGCESVLARMVQPINRKLVWFLDKEAASKLECVELPE